MAVAGELHAIREAGASHRGTTKPRGSITAAQYPGNNFSFCVDCHPQPDISSIRVFLSDFRKYILLLRINEGSHLINLNTLTSQLTEYLVLKFATYGPHSTNSRILHFFETPVSRTVERI